MSKFIAKVSYFDGEKCPVRDSKPQLTIFPGDTVPNELFDQNIYNL